MILTINVSSYDSIYAIYSDYWLFFIDEQPEYLWGHDCKYVFVSSNNGDFWIKNKNLPPHEYNSIMEDVSISQSYSDNFFPVSVQTANQCLSHYGAITKQNKGIGLTAIQKQHFIDVFNSNKIDYLGTKALYELLQDGGDTPGTITEIEGAWPDEMWKLRNALLEKSPHLTREVLVETANRTDLFPDAVIFEIFSANPDAMKDKSLLEYLANKQDPLPQYMIDILSGSAGTISYQTILESDMAEYGGNKSRAANIIVRNILNDSIVNIDSLISWIGNCSTMSTDYQVVDIYMQNNDTASALALIDALPVTYNFEADNTEFIRYKNLKQLQAKLLSEDRNIYMLAQSEKNLLENIASNSNGRAGM